MTTAKEPRKTPKSTIKRQEEDKDSIDYTDIPKVDSDWFERAELVGPGQKTLKTNIDLDVVEWFQGRWSKYRSRMNQVLCFYLSNMIQPHAKARRGCQRVMVVGKFDQAVMDWLKDGSDDYDDRISLALRDFMEQYKEPPI